jgi:hypothetical protein
MPGGALATGGGSPSPNPSLKGGGIAAGFACGPCIIALGELSLGELSLGELAPGELSGEFGERGIFAPCEALNRS